MYQKYQSPFKQKSGFILPLVFTFLLFSFCGKSRGPAGESQRPAKVENAVQESMLSTVTLSPEAEERLGIEISAVENKILPRSMELGGEVISVPGNDIKLSAPVAGTVNHPSSGQIPPVGEFVKKGEEILRLYVLPPEKDLLGAQEEVAVRQEELKVAEAKANRSQQLLANKAISEKAYEEVQAELARARGALNTALARLKLLSGAELDQFAENLSTLVLESPVDGILQRIFVAPGQTVPAAMVLLEVAKFWPVWIRVPVYIGDLARIDLEQEATVIPLGMSEPSRLLKAKPVQGPPLSDAASASADLFYEMPNDNMLFRIGQKVKVSLLEKSPEESAVVPFSAILYDTNGGKWVYVKIAPHVYSRRRVEVSHVVKDWAILTRGLEIGDQVVAAGAAEIFGTEFGVGK